MILNIYSVFDGAAQAYLTPFFVPNKGIALRGFGDAANDPQHHFHKHPGDYTLFELGTYDDVSGDIVMHENRDKLGCAIEFIAPAQPSVVSMADTQANGLDAGANS